MNMVDEIYKAGVESLPVDYTVYPGSFEDVLLRAAAVMAVMAASAGAASTAAEQATLDARDLYAIRSAYLDAAGTNGTLPELVGAVRRGAAPLVFREPEVRLTRDDIKPERLRAVAVDAQACTGLVDTATNDAVFGFILPTGPLAIRLDLAGVKSVRNLLNRLPIARDEPEDPEVGALVEEGLRTKVAELSTALTAARKEKERLKAERDKNAMQRQADALARSFGDIVAEEKLHAAHASWPQLRDALARAEIEAARLRAEVAPLVDAAADAMATRDEHLERIGKAVRCLEGANDQSGIVSREFLVSAISRAMGGLREPGDRWLQETAAASEERRSHLAALKLLGWQGQPVEEWARAKADRVAELAELARIRDAAENMVVQADAVRHALGITRGDDIITAAQTAARALRGTT